MNFFRIPRARLQKASESSSHNEETSSTTDGTANSTNDVIPTIFGERREINRNTTQNDEIQTEITPALNFQGPKNLYGRLPILGQQRFIINLMKFPSIISALCGCLLLSGQIFDFTLLMKSLSIVSIVSGAYSFVITWLICGQSNYQHTPNDTGRLLNVKIIQLFGSALFFGGQTILALFSILQIKGLMFNYVEIEWIDNNYATTTTTGSTESAPTTVPSFLSESTVLCLDSFLFATGLIGICLSIMAAILAIIAKNKLETELQKYERKNLARANAINFSFGQLRSTM